jgi:hypothetical protein
VRYSKKKNENKTQDVRRLPNKNKLNLPESCEHTQIKCMEELDEDNTSFSFSFSSSFFNPITNNPFLALYYSYNHTPTYVTNSLFLSEIRRK